MALGDDDHCEARFYAYVGATQSGAAQEYARFAQQRARKRRHCDRPLPLVLWFLDAGDDETIGTLSWPASKKRQGTKSREVGHRLSSGRCEDLMPAPLSMVSATRARGDVHCLYTGEPKIVRWASRQA